MLKHKIFSFNHTHPDDVHSRTHRTKNTEGYQINSSQCHFLLSKVIAENDIKTKPINREGSSIKRIKPRVSCSLRPNNLLVVLTSSLT